MSRSASTFAASSADRAAAPGKSAAKLAAKPVPQTTMTRRPPLTPEMVGFRLLKLTNLLTRPFFGKFAKQHAITLTEWRTIVVLANRPGIASQDIAALTGLHPMNISRAVTGLRKAGRLRDERDPENHRRSLLWLTDSGQRLFQEIAPHSEQQAAFLLEPFSEDELYQLAAMVDKLLARAEEFTAGD
ncbi:MAG: MarR family winged helix-turn-helix transcriptional regulator [Pigmentiphaga sp.]|nr:MarR family winged helix-turn-helix transcriptional regulator [Pigmentiphaga sp.]